MKKNILIAVLLYSTGIISAADQIANDNIQNYTGFYLGAGVSYNKNKNRVPYVAITSEKTKRDINSAGADLLVGYFYQLQNNIIAGLEAGCTFSSRNSKTETSHMGANTVTNKMKKERFSPRLGILLGYSINNKWLPFIKVGVTHLKQTSELNVCYLIQRFRRNISLKSTSSRKTISPFVGIGCDYRINKLFSVRLEGQYVFKRKTVLTNNTGFERSSYSVRLAAIYHI